MYEIFNEDCVTGLKRIANNSVDCIICDLPYNLTECAWDKGAIDLDALWLQFKRILKPYNAAVMFASGKFTHKLITSNPEWYKYKWIWVKNAPTMFVQAKNAPMRAFEEILIFSDGVINHKTCTTRRMKYNPQGVVPCGEAVPYAAHISDVSLQGGKLKSNDGKDKPSQLRAGGRGDVRTHGCKKRFQGIAGARPSHVDWYIQEQTGYPTDVLEFKVVPNGKRDHPTQKPVDLLEYLIKTYTNEGETVLDATFGSGSTGVACINTGRQFIGFETEKNFFDIAKKRIDDAIAKKEQSLF